MAGPVKQVCVADVQCGSPAEEDLLSPPAFCVPVGERESGVAKVAQWQHTMYDLDSGINSGAPTVRDDDGEYSSSKHYTLTTTVTREEPGTRSRGTGSIPPSSLSSLFIFSPQTMRSPPGPSG